MKIGELRFLFYLDQIEPLLAKAASQKDPALWLHRNNARTVLFMLEGLAKLYANIHNKKVFTKIKDHFKKLEDALGAIDYYDAFNTEFTKNKNIPADIKNYVNTQKTQKIKELNEILTDKKWIADKNDRAKKIRKKLSKADWMNEGDEIKAINDFYGKAIYEIAAFVQKSSFNFNNIETDVHELRRKLRWLSIYAQALQGSVQLNKSKPVPKHLTKYLTRAIINSPFNKLPKSRKNQPVLYFNENYFLSLSWIIEELGKLKDSGLRIIILKEALQNKSPVSDKAAYDKATKLLGNKQEKIPAILNKAGKICKIYFEENNLEHLVNNIKKAV